MQLYQHIFGRVSRGFRANREGYQVAALSPELNDFAGLVEGLNNFSFFQRYPGESEDPRYSFFRPAEGWLAFGCASQARDETNSLGSFAHNYVCREEDFLRQGAAPPAILRSLRFHRSESEIGDREIPPSSPELSANAPESTDRWDGLALYLAATFLGESALRVPLVYVAESEQWNLLDAVFRVLPRHEAARLTFSTLFWGADQWLNGFRLVLLPDEQREPRNPDWYQFIRAAQPPSGRDVPLTRLVRDRRQLAGAMLLFLDLLRPPTLDLRAAAKQFPELRPHLKLLRPVLETLKIDTIYGLLVLDRNWLVDFALAGKGLDERALAGAVAASGPAALVAALDASARIGQRTAAPLLLLDLAARVSSDTCEMTALEAVAAAGYLADFYAAACAPSGASDASLQSLAAQLSGHRLYRNEIHRALTLRVLDAMQSSRRMPQVEHWIRMQQAEDADPLIKATAALCSDTTIEVIRAAIIALDDADYRRIAKAALGVVPDRQLWFRLVHSHRHCGALIELCAGCLPDLDADGQSVFLRTILGGLPPNRRDQRVLADAVARSSGAYAMAQIFLDFLSRRGDPDPGVVDQLNKIPKPRPRLRFF